MSASHPSEAEGRTPSPDLCMINQLVDGSWKCYTHDAGASRCALAARSPAPSDGYLSPELEREYQSIVASHYEDIPPAAPSVEARETVLGYPLRVDASIPADEIRFVQNGQIVGVIRLAASLSPQEKT